VAANDIENGRSLSIINRLEQEVGAATINCVKMAEQINGINDRITRTEEALAALITELKDYRTKEREATCPFIHKLEEYDRTIYGEQGVCKKISVVDTRQDKLERTLSYYKGAVWVLGGIVALLTPFVITALIKIL
jgi:predicted RNase H-like nuclease (RuvC/YqgF family)